MLELVTAHPLSLADSDARHGWGCFETLRIQQGAPRWLDRHLARLAEGCRFLGLPEVPSPDQVSAFLQAHTDLGLRNQGTLRLLAVDGLLQVRVDEAPTPLSGPLKVCLSRAVTRLAASPLNRFKTLSYLENRLLHREAEAFGCLESLALNERGQFTDGGRTTLLLRRKGRWLTPPQSAGALPGVARGLLLEAGLLEEAELAPGDLAHAEGIALVNALRGLLPVDEVQGHGHWAAAPESAALREALDFRDSGGCPRRC